MAPLQMLLESRNAFEPSALRIPHALHVAVALFLVVVLVAVRAQDPRPPLAYFGGHVVCHGHRCEYYRLLLAVGEGDASGLPIRCGGIGLVITVAGIITFIFIIIIITVAGLASSRRIARNGCGEILVARGRLSYPRRRDRAQVLPD